jgi:hypothetical protein
VLPYYPRSSWRCDVTAALGGLYKPLLQAVPRTEKMSNFSNLLKILAVEKKIRAGFDMSDWTIPL